MTENDLTLDEALKTQCEHGLSKVIVCPKCNPEKYVFTPAQMDRLRQQHPEWFTEAEA